jgi:hypothetical protein
VRAVLPPDLSRIDQLKVSLVNQRGCLKKMPASLAQHVMVRQPVQLIVDQGHELIEG